MIRKSIVAVGLWLAASTSSFGTLVPMDTIDVYYENLFYYEDFDGTHITDGITYFGVFENFVSDPDKVLDWTVSGYLEYSYSVHDEQGTQLREGADRFDTSTVDLGQLSINDFFDPLVIVLLQDAIDPMETLGISTTPLEFPVYDAGFDEFSFEFESYDRTDIFGQIPTNGYVDGYIAGVIHFEGVIAQTTSVPDDASTALLGFLGFGMLLAATRSRKFES